MCSSDLYDPLVAEADIRALYERLGRLPSGLFINSTIAFEGVLRFLKTLDMQAFEACVIGCYDWDPFASFLHFPVLMIRQDTETLMTEAFRMFDTPGDTIPRMSEIRPELIIY